MKLRNILVILIWALCVATKAFADGSDVPLPQGVYTVDQLFDEFRGNMRTKIEQLVKNFTAQQTLNQMVLRASTSTKCQSRSFAPGEVISRIAFTTNSFNDELHETITYYGCDGQPTLTENVVTRGTLLSPVTWGQVILGQRSFQLKNNETFRSYNLIDDSHKSIVSAVTKRDGKVIVTHFSAFSQGILDMREEIGPEKSYVVYKRLPFHIAERHGRNSMKSNIDSPDPEKFLATQYANGQYFYSDSAVNTPISLSDFQKQFASQIIGKSLDALDTAISLYTGDFPATQFVGFGVRDSRMLTELTRVLNGLLTGTDTNYIKAIVREYIDDIQKGLLVITDNRPGDKN